MKVYIAGPYTMGDVGANVHYAIRAAAAIRNMGHAVYCPHLMHFWHMVDPRPYEDWLDHCLEFLAVCNVMVRLPGDSKGADVEEARARTLGIPIYKSVGEFVQAFGTNRRI